MLAKNYQSVYDELRQSFLGEEATNIDREEVDAAKDEELEAAFNLPYKVLVLKLREYKEPQEALMNELKHNIEMRLLTTCEA